MLPRAIAKTIIGITDSGAIAEISIVPGTDSSEATTSPFNQSLIGSDTNAIVGPIISQNVNPVKVM